MRRRNVTLQGLSLIALLSLALGGCSRSPRTDDASDSGLRAVAVQLNWYPEAEHGGVYAARAAGLDEAAGITLEIRPGGRATPVGPEVAMGRVDFAITNADDVVLFRAEGADVVAVLAPLQDHPRCILVRADSGIESLEQLQGITLQRQAGRPFVEFLRQRGLLEGVQEVPYHGSVASLVNDPGVAVQAYSFAEPLLAEQQGVEVRCLMVSDLGWNPYASVLVTRGDLIREDPDRVRRTVQAVRAGWQRYLEDPEAANALILAANEHGMTEEVLRYGAEQLRSLAVPEGMALDEVGQMTADRWEELVAQMTELGLIAPDGVTAADCYTTAFLNP